MKRTPLKRKVAIRKQSPKRAKEARVFSKRRKAFLEENPFCSACNLLWGRDRYWSEHVHHVELRGPKYLDESTWMGLCRECHSWVHDNGKAARALGLLK